MERSGDVRERDGEDGAVNGGHHDADRRIDQHDPLVLHQSFRRFRSAYAHPSLLYEPHPLKMPPAVFLISSPFLRGKAECDYRTAQTSSITGFVSVPRPVIVTATVSPALRNHGGLRAKPTPLGVPVAITSPGSSVVHSVMCAIRVGMSKIILPVWLSCTTSPLRVVWRSRFCGS